MYNPYYPYMQQQPIQQPVQQQQIQSSFVVVSNEDEIRRYPVAPGGLITFRIENQPIIVEKSLGYSQFDSPHYERYRMTKEDMPEVQPKEYILKSDYENAKNEIFSQIEDLKSHISALEKKPTRKKVEENE